MTTKTSIHSIFATDRTLEENGAWVPINEFRNLAVKIRRSNSDTVVKGLETLFKEKFSGKSGKAVNFNDLSTDDLLALTTEHMAKYVLIDWKNLTDEDTGKNIPYSVATAVELLGVKDFREFVVQAAEGRAAFKESEDRAVEKN